MNSLKICKIFIRLVVDCTMCSRSCIDWIDRKWQYHTFRDTIADGGTASGKIEGTFGDTMFGGVSLDLSDADGLSSLAIVSSTCTDRLLFPRCQTRCNNGSKILTPVPSIHFSIPLRIFLTFTF